MTVPENYPSPLEEQIERVEVILTIREYRLGQITESSKKLEETFAEIEKEGSYHHIRISEPYYWVQHTLEYLDFYAGIFAMREGFYLELCEFVTELLEEEYLEEYTKRREKLKYRWKVSDSLDYLENFSKRSLGFDRSQHEVIDQGRIIRNKIAHEAGMIPVDLENDNPLYNLKIWESYAKACREMLESIGKEMNDVVQKVDTELASLTDMRILR